LMLRSPGSPSRAPGSYSPVGDLNGGAPPLTASSASAASTDVVPVSADEDDDLFGATDITACGIHCLGGGVGRYGYVGKGGGEYKLETSYRYVGQGGDHGSAERSSSWLVAAPFGCCGVLLMLPLLWWWTFGHYDCDYHLDEWDSWTEEKIDYCCKYEEKGCSTNPYQSVTQRTQTTRRPTTTLKQLTSRPIADNKAVDLLVPAPPPPSPPADPFNCEIGAPDSWGQPEQHWCCVHRHLGCKVLPELPPPDPYNCAVGWSSWKAVWSIKKKNWCCNVHHRGCEDFGPRNGLNYDCSASYANWMVAWSDGKKDWCCKNEQKGCSP